MRASASARELPGALELRRVGADRNSRARADADATELQGDGESLGGKHREEEERRGSSGGKTPGRIEEERREEARRRPGLLSFLFS